MNMKHLSSRSLLGASLALLLAGCVVVPYPVKPEITRVDDVEIIDPVYVTIGPRRLIDAVSESIVKNNADIELADPLSVRDTAFPDGGWSLQELLQSGRCKAVAEQLDIQYLVLLAPAKLERGKGKGVFIPLAFGAMKASEKSTLSAVILDLARGSLLCQVQAEASGHERLLYYVIYIVAADPRTEAAVIEGLGKTIAETLASHRPGERLRIAVLAAEGSEQPLPDLADTQKP
jgi:hypothetical protein